jgi:thiol:disulfide interchange protein DsbD
MDISPVKRLGLALAAPLLLGASAAPAAKPTIVMWSVVSVSPTSVKVKANVAKGWHVYALTQTQGGPKPLTFTLVQPNGFTLGAPIGPTPQRAMDTEFGIQTETYSGTLEFTIPLVFKGARPRHESELSLVVRYQSCSDKLCLPPLKEELRVKVPARG